MTDEILKLRDGIEHLRYTAQFLAAYVEYQVRILHQKEKELMENIEQTKPIDTQIDLTARPDLEVTELNGENVVMYKDEDAEATEDTVAPAASA